MHFHDGNVERMHEDEEKAIVKKLVNAAYKAWHLPGYTSEELANSA